MKDTDFLDQSIPESVPETNLEEFSAPSWEDVKAGKVNYKELPADLKNKVKQEAKEETPEDKKWLWDQGYTPPEIYGGFDRAGNKVEAYDLEGFEKLLERRGIPRPPIKTKIEQDVENLTNIVKEQNKINLSQQERDIEKRMKEARDDGNFDEFQKLIEDKQDLTFRKIQLDKTPESKVVQPLPENPYSLEEQADMKIFSNQNKSFVDIMKLNREMTQEFDQVSAELMRDNPSAPLGKILTATKTIVENSFNLNKSSKPMYRGTIQSESKTDLNPQPAPKITYFKLNDRDKRWVDSEAKSGKAKYAGRTKDEIANLMYGHLLKK